MLKLNLSFIGGGGGVLWAYSSLNMVDFDNFSSLSGFVPHINQRLLHSSLLVETN